MGFGPITGARLALGALGAAGASALAYAVAPESWRERLQQLPHLARRAMHNPHQAWFVVRNFDRPWLAELGASVVHDARRAEAARYGRANHLDDDADAFRHTYAAALMTLRAMRDHGVDPTEAEQLTVGLGHAHELDGASRSTPESAAMDEHNNSVGASLVGTGRTAEGAWLTPGQLRRRVVAALEHGQLEHVDPVTGRPAPTDGTFVDETSHDVDTAFS